MLIGACNSLPDGKLDFISDMTVPSAVQRIPCG